MLFTQYIIGSRLNQLEMNFDKYIESACCCNINLVLYGITEIDNNPIFTELQKAIASSRTINSMEIDYHCKLCDTLAD